MSLSTLGMFGFLALTFRLQFQFLFLQSPELLLGNRTDGRACRLRDVAAAHLPFHEFGECPFRARAEFFIRALLGYPSVRAENDDCVGSFDGGESVGDANGCVVPA